MYKRYYAELYEGKPALFDRTWKNKLPISIERSLELAKTLAKRFNAECEYCDLLKLVCILAKQNQINNNAMLFAIALMLEKYTEYKNLIKECVKL